MLVTVKAVVLPSARRADGTWNVKIRITFKRQSRWLPTPILVTQAQLTRSCNIKDATAAMNAERHVASIRASLAKIPPFWLDDKNVDDVVAWLRQDIASARFRLDFFAFGREVAARKGAGTAKVYASSLNAFARFLGRDTYDISELTRADIMDFVATLSPETAASYVSPLRAIYYEAKLRYNGEGEKEQLITGSPFSGFQMPKPQHRGQRPLTVAEMQRLISAHTDDVKERRALDWFVISFALMGMNYIDMYEAAPPKDGVLIYRRRKTRNSRADGALMHVRVPDCIAPFVERQRAAHGAYWLRANRELDEHQLANDINMRLKGWAVREGLPPFTMYAARHTWATIGRSSECGIPYPVIQDCLNHKAAGLLDIYAERDWRTLDEANAKVLALFRW